MSKIKMPGSAKGKANTLNSGGGKVETNAQERSEAKQSKGEERGERHKSTHVNSGKLSAAMHMACGGMVKK